MKYSRLFIVTFIVILFNLAIYNSSFTKYINFKIFDMLDSIIGYNTKASSSVIVVDIDERSLKALGQWPWSRIVLANLIHKISTSNPAGMGIDIIFPEEDRTSPKYIIDFYKKYFSFDVKIAGLPKSFFDNDKIFTRVLQNINCSLAVYLNDEGDKKCPVKINGLNVISKPPGLYKSKGILCNADLLAKSKKNVGFINMSPDSDGILRRLPLFSEYNGKVIPNLIMSIIMGVDSLTLSKNYVETLGKKIYFGDKSEVLLRFYNSSFYKKISALDLLREKIPKEMLRGKFVLVGSTSAGLHDMVTIPNAHRFAGVFVLSTLLDNILKNDLRYEPSGIKWVNFLLANFFLIWLIYLMFSKKYIKLILFFTAILFSILLISYIFLLKGIYIDSAYFITPFLVGFFFVNIIVVALNYQEKKHYKKEISKAYTSAIDNMSLVVEIRDTETGAHIKRTKEYVKLIGRKMLKREMVDREFVELLYMASPLHDIGKVGIPDNILKKEGKLTEDEYEIMKRHSTIGKNILDNALMENKGNKLLEIARSIAYCHHEKWDGSGYPQGLKGEEIPLEARIMALADVYDALTSRRVYKESFDFEKSEKIILNGRGTHFDPVIVDIFKEHMEKFRDIAISIHD